MIEDDYLNKVRINISIIFIISTYGETPSSSLGLYTAIGTQNGRYIYQMEGQDRFLEYGDRYWLVTAGVGRTTGRIHHTVSSVCPQHIRSGWRIASRDGEGEWKWNFES